MGFDCSSYYHLFVENTSLHLLSWQTNKFTFLNELNYILFFTNMFRSPSWPSSGCLRARTQLIHNNSKKLYDKTTQCHTSFSTTKHGYLTSTYKFTCAVLPLTVTCLYLGAKCFSLHILLKQMVAFIFINFSFVFVYKWINFACHMFHVLYDVCI
jgi:hypothetical protein